MAVRVLVEGTPRVFATRGDDDLLEVFQSNDEPIATSCGGVASCGLCRVTVVAGGQLLVPIKPQELVHLGNVAKVIGLRLACQARLLPDADGELVVRIPKLDDVEERKRRKAERGRLDRKHPRVHDAPTRDAPIEWRPNRVAPPEDDPKGKGRT